MTFCLSQQENLLGKWLEPHKQNEAVSTLANPPIAKFKTDKTKPPASKAPTSKKTKITKAPGAAGSPPKRKKLE